MSPDCIEDPLAAVRVAASLTDGLAEMGFVVSTSSKIDELNACKLQARGKPVTPLFASEFAGLNGNRLLWMKLTNSAGAVLALQAFRYDYIDTNLNDWAPSYIIGLYMKAKELLVPTFSTSDTTVANGLRGRLIYHGELWVDPQVKNRKVLDAFTRLGLVLSVLRWNPDAVWALTAEKMALHGHPTRMGYNVVEGGFLRWQWAPDDNPIVEWLLVAERSALSQIVSEMALSVNAPAQAWQAEPVRFGSDSWPKPGGLEELFAVR